MSLRPAVTTSDQWVVTKTDLCGGSLPAGVVPGAAACKEVLTLRERSRNPTKGKSPPFPLASACLPCQKNRIVTSAAAQRLAHSTARRTSSTELASLSLSLIWARWVSTVLMLT